MSGYIKIWRGWQESDMFADEPYCSRAAWLWLVSNAAWKRTARINAKGERIIIERGQIHVSLRSLSTAFGWSKSKVERFLARLESETAIVQKAGQAGSVITICNYAKFQDQDNEPWDSRGTASETATGQSRDTQEEGKEGKEEKKLVSAPKSAAEISCPIGVDGQLWNDFMAARKKKGAPVTQTALDGIQREAAKAGWTMAEALTEIVTQGWRGFKADWIKPRAGASVYSDHGPC